MELIIYTLIVIISALNLYSLFKSAQERKRQDIANAKKRIYDHNTDR